MSRTILTAAGFPYPEYYTVFFDLSTQLISQDFWVPSLFTMCSHRGQVVELIGDEEPTMDEASVGQKLAGINGVTKLGKF